MKGLIRKFRRLRRKTPSEPLGRGGGVAERKGYIQREKEEKSRRRKEWAKKTITTVGGVVGRTAKKAGKTAGKAGKKKVKELLKPSHTSTRVVTPFGGFVAPKTKPMIINPFGGFAPATPKTKQKKRRKKKAGSRKRRRA